MKILIVGGGGREHALAWKLSKSPRITKLFAAPGSDAIAQVAECVALEGLDAITDFAEKQGIALTVVGPEAPLVDGLVDKMQARGLKVFGPTAAAAQLEGSKVFAKDFMKRHGVPTAPYAAFTDVAAARDYLARLEGPYVIKADGLAAGKGVLICQTREEARSALDTVMVDKSFGTAGEQVVIEGFLRGEEASYFVITDGQDFVTLPSAQDHKPIGDLDKGPNTGGMGAYCPAPVMTPQVERRVLDEVVNPTLAGMAAEGNRYTGVLYVGLMIDGDGNPAVVEYNCRFGDPECQPLMMMLESDLSDILEAAVDNRLGEVKPVWRDGAAACVVMASGGYPGAYAKGIVINGLNTEGWGIEGLEIGKPTGDSLSGAETSLVFHAGSIKTDGDWMTNGGRVLGVTGWGPDLNRALERAYHTVSRIHWDNANYRKDIGLKGMKRQDSGRPALNVGLVLGSASDMPVAEKATDVLKKLGIGYELAVASAHRTPERVRKYITACEEGGAEVFIAIAGMAAALPGVVAAETLRPVIGVPVKSSAFEGMDALLSIAQMPPGIPVATVAVGGGANAALLAAHILAIKYADVAARLREYRLEQVAKIEEAHMSAGLSQLI